MCRSARWGGTAQSPPWGGEVAPCAAGACGDRRPGPLDGAVCGVDPATGAGVPATRSFLIGCQRAAHRGLRAAQPVPLHPAPGHRRTVDRRCRLEHLGRDQPRGAAKRRPRRTSAGPCYEERRHKRLPGRWPQSVLVPVLDAPVRSSAPYYTYNHSACVVRLHRLPHRRLVHHRRGVSQGGSFGAVQRRVVLRRPHPRRDLGVLPGTNGLPDPSQLQSFVGVDRRAAPPGIRST